MNPGVHNGRKIRRIVCSRLAPSIRAASSSSFGTVLKYPSNSQAQNGTSIVG
jgi:hypothetical protein